MTFGESVWLQHATKDRACVCRSVNASSQMETLTVFNTPLYPN
jgi:hypothetical protein